MLIYLTWIIQKLAFNTDFSTGKLQKWNKPTNLVFFRAFFCFRGYNVLPRFELNIQNVSSVLHKARGNSQGSNQTNREQKEKYILSWKSVTIPRSDNRNTNICLIVNRLYVHAYILTNYDNGNWFKIKDLMILLRTVSFLVESPSSDHLYEAATFISLESVGRGFLIVNPFKSINSPVFATSIKRSSRAWYTCFGYILKKKKKKIDVGKFSPRRKVATDCGPVAAPIMHLVLVSK